LFPAPVSFFPLWAYLNQQIVPGMLQEFKGNPFLFPFFSDFYINIEFQTQLQRVEAIHLDLAMIYLEQGDNEKAKNNFEHAASPTRRAFSTPVRSAAAQYFRLMESAGH
jgi:hypothetical protein